MSERKLEYEPFACAPALKLEAHERVSRLQIEALNGRLDRIEALIERLEKRLWLAVYGVAGVILAQAFVGLTGVAP
ncbi:GTA head formation protein, RCAP_rcc01685 family [Salipiger abyssi]|uniref:GTA head formation protein, RCAP_rcc01685 family n=1 Tax=Salipiger abyssi TaxID=1250539 RepID=UPI00405A3896